MGKEVVRKGPASVSLKRYSRKRESSESEYRSAVLWLSDEEDEEDENAVVSIFSEVSVMVFVLRHEERPSVTSAIKAIAPYII